MKPRICIFAIIAMCILPGCKSSGGSAETETAGTEKQENVTQQQRRIENIEICGNSDEVDELDDPLLGYICENNTWVCKSYEEKQEVSKKEKYCGGIALTTIGQWDELTKDNEVIQYKCRYGHWTCYDKSGCTCFDGNEKRQIAFGEFCENSKASCKDAEWIPEHYKYENWNLYSNGIEERYYNEFEREAFKQNADICLSDSCPCGAGDCMKFGICKDGMCTCDQIYSNMHEEFICTSYHYDEAGACVDFVEDGGILVCAKKEGCHTKDGKHYSQWATIGFVGERRREYNEQRDRGQYEIDVSKREALTYHIDAGFDTTSESTSVYGECVLDRKDGLVRQSLAKGADSFVCDESTCQCGSETCKLGDICDKGKCRKDNCKAEPQTKWMCDVDLEYGTQGFENPKAPNTCVMWQGGSTNSPYNQKEFEEDYLDRDDYERSTGRMYYDVIKCEGGHRYCHGRNNTPILAPEKADGYECLDVSSLPNIAETKYLKTWVCTNEKGCACGESSCKYSESCIDGVCVPVSRPVKYCHGSVMPDGYHCKLYNLQERYQEMGMECTLETCSCGDTVCRRGELCSEGHCYITYQGAKDKDEYIVHYPASSEDNVQSIWTCDKKGGCDCHGKRIKEKEVCRIPCYGDGILDKTGCKCGGKKLSDVENQTCFKKDDQYLVLCNNPTGCTCGKTKCPMSTYCSKGQCMDPLTGKAIAESSDKLEPVTSCMIKKAGRAYGTTVKGYKIHPCQCGPTRKDHCEYGQFCMGGKCTDKVYARIKNGKRIFYDFKWLSAHFDDYKESYSDYHNDTYLEGYVNHYAWHQIQSGLADEFEDNQLPMSEYIIVPDMDKECYCGACDSYPGNEYMSVEKLICALSSGCTCGSEKCSYGASCVDNKCVSKQIEDDDDYDGNNNE